MADMQITKTTEGTDQKKSSGWVLALWLLAPVVFLIIITVMGYGK